MPQQRVAVVLVLACKNTVIKKNRLISGFFMSTLIITQLDYILLFASLTQKNQVRTLKKLKYR